MDVYNIARKSRKADFVTTRCSSIASILLKPNANIVTTLLTQSKFYNFNPYSNDTSLLDPAPIETVLNTFCSKY
uniref:Uncharacterized protein n=1 Tax=Glossina palpalis gambiensis TaxID=67801 RepID=A0A1B0B279_9MUSC